MRLVGNENIKFQRTDIKHRKLEAIFQRAIDHVNTLDYNKKPDKLKEWEFRDIELLRFMEETTSKEFIDYCKKEWNLVVKRFILNSNHLNNTPKSRYINGMYAVDLAMNDLQNVVDQMYRYSGDSSDRGDVSEAFNELADVFEPDTGKLKSITYGPNKKEIFVDIYFDQIGAFLAMDRVNNTMIDGNLDAGEAAAIMLHEIGHVITLIEHAAHQYYALERVTGSIKDILQRSDKDSLEKQVIPLTKELIAKATKENRLSKKDSETLNGIVEAMDYTLREGDETFFGTVGALFFNIFFVTTYLITFSIIFGVFIHVLGSLVTFCEETYANTTTRGKTSDTMAGPRNVYHCERLADEFVSRLGAGGYLASALLKLNQILKAADKSFVTYPNKHLNNSNIMRVLQEVTMLFISSSTAMWPVFCYEEEKQRMQRLLQNNMKVFKNALPKDTLDYYIKDTERLMKVLKEQEKKAWPLTKFYMWLRNWCPLANPSLFMMTLLTGNVTKEVDEMLYKVEDIMGSKLNFHGAKFKQLANAAGTENLVRSFDTPDITRVMRDDSWEELDVFAENVKNMWSPEDEITSGNEDQENEDPEENESAPEGQSSD